MESHCSVGINNHFWYLQSTFDLLNLSRVTPHLINWTVLEMRNFQAQRTEPQRHSCRLSNPNHHLIWVFQFHSAYKPYFVHRYKDTWGYRYPSCISTQLFLLTVHRHLPHCESSFCVIAISLLWALGLPFSSHLRKCSLHSEQGLLKERRRRTRNGAGGGRMRRRGRRWRRRRRRRRIRTVSIHPTHDEQGAYQREKGTDSCTPRVGGNIHGTWEELEEGTLS